MKLISDLLLFLKNPKNLKKGEAKFITDFKNFVIYDLTITFLWAFAVGMLTVTFVDFAMVFKSKKSLGGNFTHAFLIIVFIGPIIEELAFRFSLKVNKLTVAVSLSVQLIFYLHILKFIDVGFYVRIILMVVCSFILYFTISSRLSLFLKKKFNYYLYYNLFAFGFLHALNFSYFEVFHYLFIPILVSVQLLFGLYLSYIRIRRNISYAIGFHIFHNALIFGWGQLMSSY
ncbi:hypothetical protein BUL40_03210 [Croceivirga radicis]|uniref:CPBP family intramembrane metalloprotease n=1 Tax=Croceivirga radicis TaxID=1929488 RepID=A0A1V6LTY2_9FLAO|nr:hypothetical protein BUL40_03210 [Croceivirga radicis]